ncbi:hypothetical protein QTP86_015475 [Hemibagrus guttatus]|nr:hypothetical protein QTP86_015475 [Hemibagrus guttatus]
MAVVVNPGLDRSVDAAKACSNEAYKKLSRYCKPLVDATQGALQQRSGNMLVEPEFTAAAILVPKLKTSWTSDEHTAKLGLDYIKDHLEEETSNQTPVDGSSASEEEDFFASTKPTRGQEVTHSLQYFYTGVTPGINFPEFTTVGQVDGGQIDYYDSNIRKAIPKTEWIQKVTAEDPDYWSRNTGIYQGSQETFKVDVATLMQRFNHTGERVSVL